MLRRCSKEKTRPLRQGIETRGEPEPEEKEIMKQTGMTVKQHSIKGAA